MDLIQEQEHVINAKLINGQLREQFSVNNAQPIVYLMQDHLNKQIANAKLDIMVMIMVQEYAINVVLTNILELMLLNVNNVQVIVFQLLVQLYKVIANVQLVIMVMIMDQEHVFNVILINGLILVPLHVLVAQIIVLL